MYANADGIVFDGVSSFEFNLLLAILDDSSNDDGDGGAKIEFTDSSKPMNNRWKKVGDSTFSDRLELPSFQLFKENFSPFSSNEISEINRWLNRRDKYRDFQFVSDEYEYIHYMAKCESITYKYVGSNIIALEVKMVNDSGDAYGSLETFTLYEGQTTIFDSSDEMGYIYPQIEIYFHKDCDFMMTNNFDSQVTIIKNCKQNETITFSGESCQISSSDTTHSPNLYEDFNFVFPRICNSWDKRKNVITIEGDCVATIKYRPFRRVGA